MTYKEIGRDEGDKAERRERIELRDVKIRKIGKERGLERAKTGEEGEKGS